MRQIDEIRSTVDEIERVLDRANDITGWKIYVQDVEMSTITRVTQGSNTYDEQVEESIESGIELKVEREGEWVEEYIFGVSSIKNLKEMIQSPSRRQKIDSSFSEIDVSKLSRVSIKGDGYFVDTPIWEEMIDDLLEAHDSMQTVNFNEKLIFEKEAIAITNHYSDVVLSGSRRYTAIIDGQIMEESNYSQGRVIGSRSFENFKEKFDLTKSEIVQQLVYMKNTPIKILREEMDLLIGPSVTGEIARVLATYFQPDVIRDVFPEQYTLIDNPRRVGGFYSYLLDDSGKSTKQSVLFDQRVRNRFKFRSFTQFFRSYRYNLTPHISNVILSGGIGSGENFTERKKSFVKITNAESSIIGLGSELKVIINVTEADQWRNGILSHPVRPFSIIVELRRLFSEGTYSNDQILTFSDQKPGASYTGWIWLPSSCYKIH